MKVIYVVQRGWGNGLRQIVKSFSNKDKALRYISQMQVLNKTGAEIYYTEELLDTEE